MGVSGVCDPQAKGLDSPRQRRPCSLGRDRPDTIASHRHRPLGRDEVRGAENGARLASSSTSKSTRPGGLLVVCDYTPPDDSGRFTALHSTEAEQHASFAAAGFVEGGTHLILNGPAAARRGDRRGMSRPRFCRRCDGSTSDSRPTGGGSRETDGRNRGSSRIGVGSVAGYRHRRDTRDAKHRAPGGELCSSSPATSTACGRACRAARRGSWRFDDG